MNRTFYLDPNTLPPSLSTVYHAIDLPYVATITEMESTGVAINVDTLHSLSVPLNQRLNDVREQLSIIADRPFNPRSYPECSWLIYDHLGFPEHWKKGKERSTEAAVIEPFRKEHVGVDLLWEFRKLDKLRGTYIDKLPTVLRGGRVYAHFNNAYVETGRLSSSDPINLQNIPKRVLPGTPDFIGWLIRSIRCAFVAPPGYKIVKFDQAQVEFRILVCLANDEPTIHAIREGRDIHLDTVATYLGESYEEVEKKRKGGDKDIENLRDLFKNINYGLAYGQTGQGLMEYANGRGVPMTLAQAGDIQFAVLRVKPGVEAWIAQKRREVADQGFLTTHYGRLLRYPNALLPVGGWENRRYRHLVAEAVREAVNGVIQGTSADVMKILQTNVRRERICRGLVGTRQILAVHDEAVYEVPDGEVDRMVEVLYELGPRVVDWQVPLDVEVGVGQSWGETEKVTR